MSVKKENEKITISDMLTGEIIDVIQVKTYEEDIIRAMILHIITEDLRYEKHGILIKYGY